MADTTKQYAQWMDIPDGKGGTVRRWFKDTEAREAIAALQSPTYDAATRSIVCPSAGAAAYDATSRGITF